MGVIPRHTLGFPRMNATTIDIAPCTGPDFEAVGFEAAVVSLIGAIARSHRMPAEIGIEFGGATGIRRKLEPTIYRLVEAACDGLVATAQPRGLRVGLGTWGELLHMVIRLDGVAHSPLSDASPELGDVRGVVEDLQGVFDVSDAFGPTLRTVLPNSCTPHRRPLSVTPPGVDQGFMRKLDTGEVGRHLHAAAVGLGLSDDALNRLAARVALVAPAPHQPATLFVGARDHHALLLVEAPTRLLAFWEPLPLPALEAVA